MPTHAPSSKPSSSPSSSDKTWIIPVAVLGVAPVLPWLGKYRSRVVGIIPARFASSRFPGKPLVQILGKPMIQVHR
ncbi:hypothetical protein B296_00055656 [Ensete ventricosum]|uniref:3-deoxy-manno-octulosonate cytidylyltransferase n=1 Tax=Ensete ventricosum TaxID=4639 RepID=A0A426XMK9_ENSVE|nr:hypothetical protein B296_00055656 [Ensete ventricosum]